MKASQRLYYADICPAEFEWLLRFKLIFYMNQSSFSSVMKAKMKDDYYFLCMFAWKRVSPGLNLIFINTPPHVISSRPDATTIFTCLNLRMLLQIFRGHLEWQHTGLLHKLNLFGFSVHFFELMQYVIRNCVTKVALNGYFTFMLPLLRALFMDQFKSIRRYTECSWLGIQADDTTINLF